MFPLRAISVRCYFSALSVVHRGAVCRETKLPTHTSTVSHAERAFTSAVNGCSASCGSPEQTYSRVSHFTASFCSAKLALQRRTGRHTHNFLITLKPGTKTQTLMIHRVQRDKRNPSNIVWRLSFSTAPLPLQILRYNIASGTTYPANCAGKSYCGRVTPSSINFPCVNLFTSPPLKYYYFPGNAYVTATCVALTMKFRAETGFTGQPSDRRTTRNSLPYTH